jgi:hypothetical protein
MRHTVSTGGGGQEKQKIFSVIEGSHVVLSCPSTWHTFDRSKASEIVKGKRFVCELSYD